MTQPDRFAAEDLGTSAWAWWSSFKWTTVSLIFWARYVGSRKSATTFGDATCMKLFGFSRSRLGLYVEVKSWTSRNGEALWSRWTVDLLVRGWLSLHRRGVHPVCWSRWWCSVCSTQTWLDRQLKTCRLDRASQLESQVSSWWVLREVI